MKPGKRILRPGCSGRDVRVMQKRLNAGLKPDGVWGPQTTKAVKAWKRERDWKPTARISRRAWEDLNVHWDYWPPSDLHGTPRRIITRVVLESQGLGFPHMTPQYVAAANARHGPTISGNRSDHQGPGNVAWAADISNASHPTPQMDRFAERIAGWFGIPWGGSGLVNHTASGYRFQLIYRTDAGGNHYNHIHIGIRKL